MKRNDCMDITDWASGSWTHHLAPAFLPLIQLNYFAQLSSMIACYSQDKSDSENELDDTLGPLGRGRLIQKHFAMYRLQIYF